MAREVRVAIIGDPSSLQRALRTADTGLNRFGQRMQTFGSRMRTVGSSMSRNLTLPLVGFGILAMRGLADAQRAMGQTEAVIRSMGIAARVSVTDVENLVSEMHEMSGMDPDAVQEMVNTLLTFREVVPIFEEAGAAALDVAAFFGDDLQTAATQVGRALNDPIRGMSALSRRGVVFTQSQRDAVEAMMAVGDVAGAQRIILQELTAEYGGQAEALGGTLTGRMGRFKDDMEEQAEAILEDLMPALESLAGMLGTVAEGYSGLTDTQQKWVAAAVGGLVVAGPLATALGGLAKVAGWVAVAVGALVSAVGGMALAVGIAAAAVVAGAVWIALHWEQTKTALYQAWINIRANAVAIWNTIVTAIRQAMSNMVTAVRTKIDEALGFIRGIPGRIGAIASGFGSILINAGRAIIQGLWDGMQAVWGNVTSWLGGLAGLIPDWKGPMSKDRKILVPTGRVIMEGLGAGMRQGWDQDVTPFLRSATGETGRFIPQRSRRQRQPQTPDMSSMARDIARELSKTVQPVVVVG